MLLIVGRVGRAHGLHGEVLVQLHTDDPDTRFAVGTILSTEPAERGPLTVATARRHSGRYVVGFTGISDRTAAKALRGIALVVDSADLPPIADPDEYHDAELLGLAVESPGGDRLGELTDIVHGPGADLLVVRMDDREVLIPFIRDLVLTVDVARHRVIVDVPEGLLEL